MQKAGTSMILKNMGVFDKLNQNQNSNSILKHIEEKAKTLENWSKEHEMVTPNSDAK